MEKELNDSPPLDDNPVHNGTCSIDLQNKNLERIESLESFSHELSYINVSRNFITKIDDLSAVVPNLKSLVVACNKLSKPESIRNVIYLRDLSELNLSNNEINCSLAGILEILAQCKSLKSLSLKGNLVAKAKHFRKLVISRCPNLIHLDGRPICGEERRRCNAWGRIVIDGGSYGEADCADSLELNRIRSEKSKANAFKRSVHTPTGSNTSKIPGARVIESIKRTFGLIDTRTASSTISWSPRRSLHSQNHEDESIKAELEQVKRIVELQRKEIISLKESLEKPNAAGGERSSGSDDDSEKETSYSLLKNQQLAEQLGRKEQRAFADITWEDCKSQMDYKNHSPSAVDNNASTAVTKNHGFDPFSVFPPIPPQNAI